MNTPHDIRWQQRLSNFGRAIALLREVLDSTPDVLQLPAIVKEGTIQRFEYTYELAWKTLKDKMEYDGLHLETIAPRYVLKAAHQHRYIEQIDVWLRMVNDRNLMSHTYNPRHFDAVLANVQQDYFVLLNQLYTHLLELSV